MDDCSDDDPGSRLLLIFDDDPFVRQLLVEVFRREGYLTIEAQNGAEALTAIGLHQASLRAVLSDLRMPLLDGAQLAQELGMSYPAIPIALMSSQFNLQTMARLPNVRHWFVKPFSIDAVVAGLGKMMADC
jgi:CheY-like chemotaxis protein